MSFGGRSSGLDQKSETQLGGSSVSPSPAWGSGLTVSAWDWGTSALSYQGHQLPHSHACPPHTAMVELDGDDVRISSRGKLAERDIVQVKLSPACPSSQAASTPLQGASLEGP